VLTRVDRRTGDRTTIELGDDAGVRAAGLVGVSRGPVGPMGQTVSPDGDVALVRRSPVSTDWLMVDLAAGRATEVPSPAPGAPVAWTADSRYAAWLSAGTMRVFDRTVGGYTDVPGTGPLHTFAVLDRAAGVAGSPSRMEELADEAHGVPAEARAPGDRSPSPATRAVAPGAGASRAVGIGALATRAVAT
jgi:hypothetical protein